MLLSFRTPQPVMCRSVSGVSCLHLLEPIPEHRHRFCKLLLLALMHIHKKHVALFVVQDSWTCMFSIFEVICDDLTEQR
jgi:hypothetical protein